jgi:steroid 5-alpha reductase family enzyme
MDSFLLIILLTSFIVAFAIILIHFFIFFLISVKKNNFGIIDIGWGLGFVFVAFGLMLWRTTLLGLNSNILGYLTLILVTIWGLRLSFHIGKRNHGKEEDRRYVAMRANIKPPFLLLKSFFKIFFVQALFMLLVSVVIIFNIFSGNIMNDGAIVWIVLGVLFWLVGYIFQSVGDQQLKAFIAVPSNKGKLMTSGLWAYTRHPNYFGEAMMWWGLAIMGFSSSFPIIIPLLGLISPIIITFLVRYLSGVPLLEKHMQTKLGFEAYKKTTSIFIPWFPKKAK